MNPVIPIRHWTWTLALGALAVVSGCGGGHTPLDRDGASVLTAKAGVVPQSGIWWNPAESGRGFTVEVQGDQLAFAMYMYDTGGKSVWYAGVLNKQPDGAYNGSMMLFNGGQSLSGNYRAPSGATTAASVSVSFDNSNSGQLTLQASGSNAIITLPLQRTFFSASQPEAPSPSIQTGVWWNPSESGRGYFIESQGTQVAIGSYMYDDSGAPAWYMTIANLQIDGKSAVGNMLQFANGQSLLGNYVPPVVTGSAGQLSFIANSNATGTLQLPGGRTVQLQKFVFSPSSATPLPGNWRGQQSVTYGEPFNTTTSTSLGVIPGSGVFASAQALQTYLQNNPIPGISRSVVSYQGCGECGVGSQVNYVVASAGTVAGLAFNERTTTTYTRTE